MAEEYHAGMEGVVLAGDGSPTTDMNITEWNATKRTNWANTTTTSGFDSATGETWESSIPTTTRLEGSFTVNFDKNAPPYAVVDSGKTVSVDFTAVQGKGFTGLVGVDSLEIRNSGIENVVSAVCNFHSVGKITWK